MDKKTILQTLVDRYAGGNKSKFARLLDVPPQTIHSWFARATFDPDLIFSKLPGVSASWLLSGEDSGGGNYLGNGIANKVTVGVGEGGGQVDVSDFVRLLEEKDKQINRLLDIIDKLSKTE